MREHFASVWNCYEELTSLCSLGFAQRWRERCVAACGLGADARILDIGTGTGPLLSCAVRRLGPRGLALGLDLSLEGLERARAQVHGAGRTAWIQGRALDLPLRNARFDAVTLGFSLRHLGPVEDVLREIRRVLDAGGRLAMLAFLRPKPGLKATLGFAYLTWVVPVIAGLWDRRRAIFRLARYLPITILDAPSPAELTAALESAGFREERSESLCWGFVWLVVARRMRVLP